MTTGQVMTPQIFTTGAASQVEPPRSDNKAAIIVGAVIGILILLIVLIVVIIVVLTRRRRPQKKMTRLEERESEIELATTKDKNTEYQPLTPSTSSFKANANTTPSQTNYSDMNAVWNEVLIDLCKRLQLSSRNRTPGKSNIQI